MSSNLSSKPDVTLFLLMSVDGKISTGDNDTMDVDQDFPKIKGVGNGLFQYYDLEKQTDRVSFNSGRVMQKVGVNDRSLDITQGDIDFVVVDNQPHLDPHGAEYFAKRSKMFYLVTTNKKHPAYALLEKYKNIKIFYYNDSVNFVDLFQRFRNELKIRKMTIQTGGTMNSLLLRLGLIDHISLVVAPCLVGGEKTQSLIGGESLHTKADLWKIKALKLKKCEVLKNSYLHLQYDVVKWTEVV